MKVDTTGIRYCAKCGSTAPPLFRHHKGCDGLLGRYNRGIAANYHRWLDCILLCLEHHCEIHYIYNKQVLNKWLNRTPSGARRIRRHLIKVCDKWLEGKMKPVEVPAEYRAEFEDRFETWKEYDHKRGRQLASGVPRIHR